MVPSRMNELNFTIPLWVDLLAVFVGAMSGVVMAVKHDFDIVGTCVLALVAGMGGALIRDGMFLQRPPVIAQSEWYVLTAVGTALFTPVLLRVKKHLDRTLDWMDAVAIGLYGMIGTQAALGAGLGAGPSVCIGLTNAVGGGLTRDILCGERSVVFRPGNFYAVAVILGCSLLVVMHNYFGCSYREAGVAGFVLTLGVRAAAVIFDIRTKPLSSGKIV